VNYDLIEAKRLKLFKRKNEYIARFHLANFRPSRENAFKIDEMWGDAEIGKSDIKIHRLKILQDVHTLLIKGKIKNYPKLKNSEMAVSGETSIYLKNLKGLVTLPEVLSFKRGYAHAIFKAESVKQKISASVDLSVTNLDSSVALAEKIIASLSLVNNVLIVKELMFNNGDEKFKIINPSELADFSTEKYLYQPIQVEVTDLKLNNALRILPSLKPLKGRLNGKLSFNYKNQDLEFKPSDGFKINDLALVVGKDKPFTILKMKTARLSAASFKVIKLKEFQMDSIVELENSFLSVQGLVNSQKVDFNVDNAIVDLEDFGNIANLDIKGRGNLDIKVSGPITETTIKLKGTTKGFEVLGYSLGKADKEISIALGDSNVIIHRLESIFRSTPISGTGVINYENLDIALGINSPKANYHDLKEILHPIFSKLDFLPSDLDFNSKIDASIYGKTRLDKLKVRSDVRFTDLLAYNENINSGEMTISLDSQVLSLQKLVARKGDGEIRGDFSFNLKTDFLKLDYKWEDLALSSMSLAKKIKLNLQGLISGSLIGEGPVKDYSLQLLTTVRDTKSQNYKFDDSKLDIEITPSFIKGKTNFLGSVLKSDFDYSFKKSRSSKINLSVNAPSLKPFAVALLGQHLDSEVFSGGVKFQLESHFLGSFEEVNLKANLESFSFKHDDFNVNYKSLSPQFLIENNKIKNWNLAISESDLFVQTSGSGRFGEQVDLVNEVHFNSKVFEILFAQILSSEGFIRNIVKIDGQKDNYKFSATSKTKDLNLTIASLTFPLNHLSYSIDYADDRLVIQEMKTSLENGSVALKGDIYFDDSNPDVNLKYILDKAEIPILGKSIINLSGEGIVLGNEPPYSVGGEITINKGQIVNELNDFSPKSNALAQVRFLPPNQESPFGKLVNLNVNIKAETPVRITNSLMDLSLKGELLIMGNPFRPKAEGRLYSPVGSSRVFFKNNEYSITNADLNFSPKKEISNPDFDVQAQTFITSYKVFAKAYGDLERFNFDLTSDPSLPRNSILSLIAFGYTDEIQNTLEQRDQQNLTQVGVGSFVFDRFKISDILNKQFGLQVNLGTVLEQSQTDSLLTGRNQEGQGTLGRTRSATKIELKKRLDEALSLSVSSTMGGSIGQRQSMNLNYSVSKKVQLEGVYELRTNADGEEDIIDNSIGGDLKFRWTFK
jgi:translocation and assembly module TamB